MTRVAPIVARVSIAAPAGAVWRLLIQQERMARWSPEVLKQFFWPSRRIRRGTISLNLNKRGWFIWPTLSRYTTVRVHEELSFFVVGPNARWTYHLTPRSQETDVELRRDLLGGRVSIASRIVAGLFLGGVKNHDIELEDGMRTTLARIKGELEF